MDWGNSQNKVFVFLTEWAIEDDFQVRFSLVTLFQFLSRLWDSSCNCSVKHKVQMAQLLTLFRFFQFSIFTKLSDVCTEMARGSFYVIALELFFKKKCSSGGDPLATLHLIYRLRHWTPVLFFPHFQTLFDHIHCQCSAIKILWDFTWEEVKKSTGKHGIRSILKLVWTVRPKQKRHHHFFVSEQ